MYLSSECLLSLPLPETSPFPRSSLPAIPPARRSLRLDAAGQTLIAGVAGVESNFLYLSLPCDVDYNHPDLPAIMVFAEYLVALEVSKRKGEREGEKEKGKRERDRQTDRETDR